MRAFIFGFIVTSFILTIIFGVWYFYSGKGASEKGITNSEELAKRKQEERRQKQDVLLEKIKVLFKEISPGTEYFISIYDLDHNETFGIDGDKPAHAASVSKVLTAVVLLDKVDKGRLALDQKLGAYDVGSQLRWMINQSNPDSWDLIDELLPAKTQNSFAKKIGLKHTNLTIGKNLMSTNDVANLFKKLAKRELLSESSRELLFSYMQKTETEDLFTPGIPKEVPFYHKAGKYKGEVHDAAIIGREEKPFVLVVFTNNRGTVNTSNRTELLTQIAAEVYSYFENL